MNILKSGIAVISPRIRRIIAWLAVVIWMGVIFSLSAQTSERSDRLSTGVTAVLARVVETVAPRATIDVAAWNHGIRKGAHFMAYLLLGILAAIAFRSSGVRGKRGMAWALLLCLLYAAGDEGHQLLVPGRGAQVTDVLLDTAGAGAGICIIKLLKGI